MNRSINFTTTLYTAVKWNYVRKTSQYQCVIMQSFCTSSTIFSVCHALVYWNCSCAMLWKLSLQESRLSTLSLQSWSGHNGDQKNRYPFPPHSSSFQFCCLDYISPWYKCVPASHLANKNTFQYFFHCCRQWWTTLVRWYKICHLSVTLNALLHYFGTFKTTAAM